MQTQQDGSRRDILLTDAFIVALAPVIGYGLAYLFELGFCSYFGIPTWLVQIELRSVFVALGVLVLTLFPLFNIFNFVPIFFRFKSEAISRSVTKILILAFIGLAFAYLYRFRGTEWLWFLLPLLLYAAVELLVPLIAFRKEPTLADKFEAAERVDSSRLTLAEHFGQRFGVGSVLLVAVTLLGSIFTYHAGKSQARFQSNYSILQQDSSLVVLRSYSDRLICAHLDSTRSIVSRNFVLIRLSDARFDSTVITPVSYGPLRPTE